MQKCLGTMAIMVLLVAVEGEISSSKPAWRGICNNGCGNGTEESFCDKRRWKDDGTVVEQCVDKTIYGSICAWSCRKYGKDYFWCYTSWHVPELWEYCAPSGQTRYGAHCVSNCSQEGKDYWWCYTAHDNSEWEYCSPQSQVMAKKVTYTIHGQECLGECGNEKGKKKYWWCKKTGRWRQSKSRDDIWDYCSPQALQNSSNKGVTRYNEQCKDDCLSRGEDYFWCNTIDSWDYCSPKALGPVIARRGTPCVGICDTMGKSYKWCTVFSSGTGGTWWDYCGEKSEAWYVILAWVLLALVIAAPFVFCCVSELKQA